MRLIDIWSIPEMGAAAILARFARHRSLGQVPNATIPPPHIQDHIHSHARSEISLCWMYSEIRNVGRDLLLRSMYMPSEIRCGGERSTHRAHVSFSLTKTADTPRARQSPESSTHKQCSCTAIYSTQLYTHSHNIYIVRKGHVPKHALKLTHCWQLTHCLAARWRSTKLFQVVYVPSCVRSVAQGSDTATSTETQTAPHSSIHSVAAHSTHKIAVATYARWLHTAPTIVSHLLIPAA